MVDDIHIQEFVMTFVGRAVSIFVDGAMERVFDRGCVSGDRLKKEMRNA
jgi:hypothetical protein